MKKQPVKPIAKAPAKAAPPVKTLAKAPARGPIAAPRAVNAEDDAGVGQEGMKAGDYSIPRLAIVQDMTPQVKKADPLYIKGLEQGNILDALTERHWDGETGILVIPISYRRAHLEWKPERGGFVADHGSDGAILSQTTRDDKGRNILPNGNSISVCGEYFLHLIDEATGSATPYLVSMSSSQLKKSRRWNTMINQLRVPRAGGGDFNPAMFYRAYRLKTVPEKNDKGSWFGWKIEGAENVLEMENGESLYTAAREFRAQIAAGAVQAAAPRAEQEPGEHADDSPM